MAGTSVGSGHSRHALVERARDALVRASSPRLHASMIVALSGLSAFLSSVVMLRLGLGRMTLRYAAAALCGYIAFVALIRAWIALQRRADERAARGSLLDALDFGDAAGRGAASRSAPTFGGGRSGGGGASRSFVGTRDSTSVTASGRPAGSSAATSSGSGGGFSLDLDELVWVVLAVALVFMGVIAVGYVIYAAPLLLGEVALDAALLGGAYRSLRRDDMQHWATGVVRRTALPAAIVIACAAGVGYCGERLAPEARSIGGVVRALRE
jgi:hypothetical protein